MFSKLPRQLSGGLNSSNLSALEMMVNCQINLSDERPINFLYLSFIVIELSIQEQYFLLLLNKF
jgi:hypothetical protein